MSILSSLRGLFTGTAEGAAAPSPTAPCRAFVKHRDGTSHLEDRDRHDFKGEEYCRRGCGVPNPYKRQEPRPTSPYVSFYDNGSAVAGTEENVAEYREVQA